MDAGNVESPENTTSEQHTWKTYHGPDLYEGPEDVEEKLRFRGQMARQPFVPVHLFPDVMCHHHRDGLQAVPSNGCIRLLQIGRVAPVFTYNGRWVARWT